MIYRVTQGDGRKKFAHPVKNREELLALRNSAENLENLSKARQGDEEAKAHLVQFAYNLGYVDGLLAGCTSIGSFFFHDVDCYDKAQSETMKNQILSKKDEIGLMMLERSAGGGWHLVCKRVPGTTILENQVRVSLALRIEMDTNTKDLQRIVFSTSGSEEDLVYLDDALFEEPMTPEQCEQEYQALKKREKKGLEDVPHGAKKSNKHYKPWEDEDKKQSNTQATGSSATSQATSQASQAPCVVEADARTRFVFQECMKEEDVTESDLNSIGGRHNSVKMILSTGIQLLTEGEFLGVLQELMPNNWNDDNIRRLVSDFYTEYYNPTQKLTMAQKRIFRESRKIGRQIEVASEAEEQPVEHQSALSKMFAENRLPEFPAKLPRLVQAVTCNTPKKFKPLVAQGMFPPLGAYPRNLSFIYIDNQIRELRINCLVVAPTGSGKDTSLGQPIAHIIADMKQRDEVNRKRLEKYNEDYNNQANNKQKPQRPDDLIIQTIYSDVTKAALVQRMKEAQRAPLYVKMNELEQWDQVEGKSGRGNHFTIMKMLDDELNDFGADRAGTQSVMGSGRLHLNFNANTTTPQAIRYFRHVLTDGPISRLCLATIPEGEIGDEIVPFGNYDDAYDQALKPFIENLKAASGVIDCPQAKRLAKKLKQECAEFARLSQDRVFDNLSHRALVHVFRKACLLYAANGMKWEKAIEDFCRWSLHYDMFLKMTIWGDQIRHADDDMPTTKRGPRSLLEYIQTNDEGVFFYSDAVNARLKNGKDEEGTKNMLYQWKSRGYILQLTDDSFKISYSSKEHKKSS